MNTTFRTPYRRSYKAADGTIRIELRDGTDITVDEWLANIGNYRVASTPDDDYDPTAEDPS